MPASLTRSTSSAGCSTAVSAGDPPDADEEPPGLFRLAAPGLAELQGCPNVGVHVGDGDGDGVGFGELQFWPRNPHDGDGDGGPPHGLPEFPC